MVDAAEYASEVKSPPPWGSQCQDARVLDDEDREARLADGRYTLHQDGDQLRLVLPFENTFAGALALENWLAEAGYRGTEIRVDDVLEGLSEGGRAKTPPKTGLFGDVRPLGERLENAPPEKVVELVFNYHSDMPDALAKAFTDIPKQQRLDLCWAQWERAGEKGRDVTWQALLIIQDLGPIAADWMRTVWQQLPSDDWGFALKSLAASLPPDEAFDLAKAWAERAKEAGARKNRLMAFGNLAHPRTLGFIEHWWESAEPGDPVTDEWGRLAAESRMSWPAARTWLERGRPLSLIALDALSYYVPRPGYPEIAVSPDFDPPDIDTFRTVLARCRDNDNSSRMDRIVGRLLENPTLLTE